MSPVSPSTWVQVKAVPAQPIGIIAAGLRPQEALRCTRGARAGMLEIQGLPSAGRVQE
jgi:hypothetical protein